MPKFSISNLVKRTTVLPQFIGDTPAQVLLKTASEADTKKELNKIGIKEVPGAIFPIRPKHAYFFVVSLGSGEAYGCNENADYYPAHDGKVVVFPEPVDKNKKEMKLGKGLESCHKTFRIHGAVYKHHKTEPEHNVPRSGEIVWERWNPKMQRGELIVELPEKLWQVELDLYEKGTPLMWSQGNGTPFDVCFVKNTPIYTPDGIILINEIKPGQKVYTHLNNVQTVSKVFIRSYVGELVTVFARDLYPITSTGNHPYFVLPLSNLDICSVPSVPGDENKNHILHEFNRRGVCTRCGAMCPVPTWLPATAVQAGDMLLCPYNEKLINSALYKAIESTRIFSFSDSEETLYAGFPVLQVHHEAMAGCDDSSRIPVYNLEIENDQSYIAGGVAVHNCSRCGYIFTPKSKQRCTHISLRKLCIEEDGLQNMIYCPEPLFYDISYVGNNPAAKIAAALLRIAEPEKGPSIKEMLKFSNVCHYSEAIIIKAIIDAENDISDEEVNGISCALKPDVGKESEFIKKAKQLPPEKVLSACHRLRIVLTPTQFARIFGVLEEPTGVIGFLDALPGIFRKLLKEDPGAFDDAGYLPLEPPESAVIRQLEPLCQDFQIQRVMSKPIIMIKVASEPKPRFPTPQGYRLAAEYAKYMYTCLRIFGGPQAARRYIGIMAAGL